jgi:hypothetical protein
LARNAFEPLKTEKNTQRGKKVIRPRKKWSEKARTAKNQKAEKHSRAEEEE